ncbi:hypothetical protein EDD85DRAFT_971348 [Armillaria nabsnona]|nr:hypothetical protein EDD85DRAFT_971348 [Armillaria nabsnona]
MFKTDIDAAVDILSGQRRRRLKRNFLKPLGRSRFHSTKPTYLACLLLALWTCISLDTYGLISGFPYGFYPVPTYRLWSVDRLYFEDFLRYAAPTGHQVSTLHLAYSFILGAGHVRTREVTVDQTLSMNYHPLVMRSSGWGDVNEIHSEQLQAKITGLRVVKRDEKRGQKAVLSAHLLLRETNGGRYVPFNEDFNV